MLTIRLSRTGKTNEPHFSVVVTEKSNAAIDGNFLEKVGHYTGTGKTPSLHLEKERINYWISKGAKPSETLARMLHKQGFEGMSRFVDFKKKFQKKPKAAAEAKVEAPTAA